MTPTLWQPGAGASRDVLVVLYCGAFVKPAVCAAAPGACVVNLTVTPTALYTRTGAGGIPTLRDLVAAAQRLAGGDWSPARVVVAAFSAGGQGATAMLDDGAEPDALVLADAWHCRIGSQPGDPALASRRRYVEAARAGRRVLVASHTRIATEAVRPTAEHPEWRPFTSSRGTLALLTGWSLDASGPVGAPVVHEEGGLRVESYEGADARAHELQAQRVLPTLVARAFAMLGARGAVAMAPEHAARLVALADDVTAGRTGLDDALARAAEAPPDPPAAPPDPPLGERALAWSLEQLGRGEEPAGSNGGPYVRGLLAPCERGGRPLGLTSGNWCAAFASAAARAAGEGAPHGYRAAVAELVADARECGAFVDVIHVRHGGAEAHPGDLAIFAREGGDPRRGGTGHVGRVEAFDMASGRIVTIDGNHGDRVARVGRRLTDADLVGFISYPRG